MSFNEFLNQAWQDHATKTSEVAERIKNGFALLENSEQIPQLAALVTHVYGEHLAQYGQGIELLNGLKQVEHFQAGGEAEQAIARSVASLQMAEGRLQDIQAFSKSDQIRILAVAASALSEQKQAAQARDLFLQAIEKARAGLAKEDPANRALAVTGHNLACAMEEKASRSEQESELMILAAQTSREFWELAGSWLQVERAEYRVSQSYLKAGEGQKSLEHAEKCLEIIAKNKAPPLEFFFAYEAIALAQQALGRKNQVSAAFEQMKVYFEKLSAEEKSWCEATLQKLAK